MRGDPKGREMRSRADGEPAPVRVAKWVDSVGSATLPLLAGFSTASVIVVSDDAANFRWPGATILALAIAAIVLIAAVQCAYHARIYLPDQPDRKDSATSSSPIDRDETGVRETESQQQDADFRLGLRWARGTQATYHCGIIALLAGLALAVAPEHTAGIEGSLRWCATVLGFVACAGQAAWVTRQEFRAVKRPNRVREV